MSKHKKFGRYGRKEGDPGNIPSQQPSQPTRTRAGTRSPIEWVQMEARGTARRAYKPISQLEEEERARQNGDTPDSQARAQANRDAHDLLQHQLTQRHRSGS